MAQILTKHSSNWKLASKPLEQVYIDLLFQAELNVPSFGIDRINTVNLSKLTSVKVNILRASSWLLFLITYCRWLPCVVAENDDVSLVIEPAIGVDKISGEGPCRNRILDI